MADSLKDEFLGENGVLALPGVRLGHLDTVQVDVTVGTGKILDWQLVGLLHIQHQAAHLRDEQDKHQCSVYWENWMFLTETRSIIQVQSGLRTTQWVYRSSHLSKPLV